MRSRLSAPSSSVPPVSNRFRTLFVALCGVSSASLSTLSAQTQERANPSSLAQPAAESLQPANASGDTSGDTSANTPKPLLDIRSGDRIAFLGSAIARAVFEDGFLPSLLKAALPDRNLHFLNLATPGEALPPKDASNTALEKTLQAAKADVVFAFFGAVEAAAGEQGLGSFRDNLAAFLKRIRQQKPGGNGPLRVVLFGPPARERLLEPFSKEGARTDALLKLYSEAVADVAKEGGVAFFDLYAATERVFATGPQRSALLPKRWGAPQSALSVNGGFLTVEANRLLAPALFEALLAQNAPDLGVPQPPPFAGDTGKSLERLATPQSSENELPFAVSKNRNASLFASETQFPPLLAPVQLDLDARGRLWVLAASEKTNSARLLVLEDSDADGQADRCTVFADELSPDSSFVLYRDGVLVQGAGDLWLLRDPADSGKVTEKRRLLSGLAIPASSAGAAPGGPGVSGSTPGGAASVGSRPSAPRRTLLVDPKGGVLLHDRPHPGVVETGLGATSARGGVYRFEPVTGRLDVVSTQANADWTGSVLDAWGRDLFHVSRGSWTTLWKQAPRGISGALAWQDPMAKELRLQVCVPGEQAGIKVLQFKSDGTSLGVSLGMPVVENLVTARQPGFFPLAQTFAADSAVFFSEGTADRGRIYKIEPPTPPVTADTPPLTGPMQGPGPRIDGAEIPALLENLRSLSDPGILQRTRNELASRAAPEVFAALGAWELGLSKKDPAYEILRLQSLWLRRWFDREALEASGPLLRELLQSPEAQVRAEAVRVVRETRRIDSEAVSLLEPLAKDPSALVRLEVLAAAAAFDPYDAAALGVVHKVLGSPLDPGLERLAKEALQKLEPDPSKMLVPAEAKALKFVLARLSPAELAKAPGVEPVLLAQVDRDGSADAVREAALQALAKLHRSGRATEIALALARLEAAGAQGVPLAQKMGELLLNSPAPELFAAEAALEKLAASSKLPKLRLAAHAAWGQAAADFDGLWKRLEKTPERQVELLAALPLVRDAQARARVRPALERVLQPHSGASEGLSLAALRALPLTGEGFGPGNFELLSGLILKERFVPEAAAAMAQLPEAVLSGEKAVDLGALAPLVSALLRWLEAVPEKERQSPQFAAALQTGRVLAGKLEAQAVAAERKLRAVKSEVCVLRPVFEQGRFEVQWLTARAGQPLEVVFENTDAVPRNVVLVAPGARETVLAEAAKLSLNQSDAEGRVFVPKHQGVLAATKLLAPGERQVLKLNAPDKPGRYEFVCTVPGSPGGLRATLEVLEK